jgi:hypothetical protein
MRHMEKNIQGVVHSVQSLNQQLFWLD